MIEGHASSTALGAAMMRAAHLLVDDDPKIMVDTYARAFLDPARRERATDTAIVGTTQTRWSRANIVARHAYAEAELADAVRNDDVGQYVLLGAGLDSSALRHRELLAEVTTFEVDHPDTQRYKRSVLAELGELADIEAAGQLRLVPVNFERDSLLESLRTAGWDPHRPTFWSWLGVTMYLTAAAIEGTLAAIATSAPGSRLITNYSVHDDDVDPADRSIRARSAAGVSSSGEPWLSTFRHADIVASVERIGFCDVASLDHRVMDERYFAGRTDGLTWRSPTAMLVATVPDV